VEGSCDHLIQGIPEGLKKVIGSLREDRWTVGPEFQSRALKIQERNATYMPTIFSNTTWALNYYDIRTRQNINLHMHQVNFATYGKGVYHMAVKVFNGLPRNLKEISNNPKKFKANLKGFLHSNSFHTLEDFFKRRFHYI
jgi:hypothetical protein